MVSKLTTNAALRDRLATVVAQLRKSNISPPATPALAVQTVRARITPLDDRGRPGISQSVYLKNFDKHGITFHHHRELLDRRALVSIESPRIGRFTAEVDLSWCRFSSRGDYTSGGRFVQLAGKSA